jgi:hypothetical protein
MKSIYFKLFVLLTAFSSGQLFAWGGRGHHSLCVAATRLVKNEDLKALLSSRANMIGHLCNVPDIYWKSLPQEQQKLGNPTHYMEPDMVGLEMQNLPTAIAEVLALKPNEEDLFGKIGSGWWRAEQFFKLSKEAASRAAESPLPGPKDLQNWEHPYNKAVFEMISSMGLMGHFVGDLSQPLHNSANYDGWDNGHGGIHSYYETQVLDAFKLDLDYLIFQRALKKQKKHKSLALVSVLDRLKELSIWSNGQVSALYKADKVLRPSTGGGSSGAPRVPAQRVEAEKSLPRFRELILDQLSESSLVLAEFWDEAYASNATKTADLKVYRSFQYPFTPAFVTPDYLPQNPSTASKR